MQGVTLGGTGNGRSSCQGSAGRFRSLGAKVLGNIEIGEYFASVPVQSCSNNWPGCAAVGVRLMTNCAGADRPSQEMNQLIEDKSTYKI